MGFCFGYGFDGCIYNFPFMDYYGFDVEKLVRLFACICFLCNGLNYSLKMWNVILAN